MPTYTPIEAQELILSGKLPAGSKVTRMYNTLEELRAEKKLKPAGILIKGCTQLQSLPDGLEVDGEVLLCDCISLKNLPIGMKVSMSLNISGCTSLTTLPEDLEVGRDLDLRRCTSLILPNGIPKGVKGFVAITEDVLRNNKDHLLNWVNTNFIRWGKENSEEIFKRVMAEF